MSEFLPGTMRERITELRISKGYTSAQKLADELGINKSTYLRIESGETRTINSDLLIKLADIFEVTVDFILCRTDVPHITYNDVNNLGLSVKSAENLFTNKADRAVVDTLLSDDAFCNLTHQLSISFSGQMKDMISGHNSILNMTRASLNSIGLPEDDFVTSINNELIESRIHPSNFEYDNLTSSFLSVIKRIREENINYLSNGFTDEYEEVIPKTGDAAKVLTQDIITTVRKEALRKMKGKRLNDEQKAEVIRQSVIKGLHVNPNVTEEIDCLVPSAENLLKAFKSGGNRRARRRFRSEK